MSPLLLQGVWPLSVVLCSRDNNSNTYYYTCRLSLMYKYTHSKYNSSAYCNTCRLSLNGTTQQHLLSYLRTHCHHNINAPTNICVYTTYASMLVGWCHVRTVKQCLLILRKKVGQCVHGCEQDNYHTHNTICPLVQSQVCRVALEFPALVNKPLNVG